MKTLAALTLAASAPLAFAEFSIKESPGKHIDVLDGSGKTVARVMTAHDMSTKESRLETYKVYTHVFDAEGGAPITKGVGDPFTHHRGIFLGWSRTKLAGGKKVDSWHMKGCTQKFGKILATDSEDDHLKLSILVHWQTDDGTVFIEETRDQIFRQIKADDGAYLEVDVHTTLKAVGGDVELNGDPEHAGLQFRPSAEVAKNKSAKYLFHADGIDPKKDQDLPWVAESFQVGGKSYFAQHMSHPALPKGNTYSAYRDYGRFGAYFVKTVKDGESLMLRYRITVGAGEMPSRDTCATRYKAFAE
jgi:hypothetical protein